MDEVLCGAHVVPIMYVSISMYLITHLFFLYCPLTFPSSNHYMQENEAFSTKDNQL